jgi:hypothetical protein
VKNNTFRYFKRNATWIIIGLLIILVVDPLGVLAGNFSNDSYSQIRTELSKTRNAKVQLIASWDDFYSLEYNNYWRAEMSTEFVERNYVEVLDAASLGEDFFNRYLVFNNITHILVPESSVSSGRIFHKFGTRGTIDISLDSAYFKEVSNSSGPFAAALFQVIDSSENVRKVTNPKYSLTWNGVGSEFYSMKNTVTEVGMYRYDYNTYYENGSDVSWFYDESPDRLGYLELKFESSNSNLETANLEIEFVAAYGPKAPSHVVVLRTNVAVGSLTLKAGKPQKISIGIKNGESIRFLNGTPCRLPGVFEPADASLKEICFGITAVRVTPPTQVE